MHTFNYSKDIELTESYAENIKSSKDIDSARAMYYSCCLLLNKIFRQFVGFYGMSGDSLTADFVDKIFKELKLETPFLFNSVDTNLVRLLDRRADDDINKMYDISIECISTIKEVVNIPVDRKKRAREIVEIIKDIDRSCKNHPNYKIMLYIKSNTILKYVTRFYKSLKEKNTIDIYNELSPSVDSELLKELLLKPVPRRSRFDTQSLLDLLDALEKWFKKNKNV